MEGAFGEGLGFFGDGLDFFFGAGFAGTVLFQPAPRVLAILLIFLSASICLASKNWKRDVGLPGVELRSSSAGFNRPVLFLLAA